MPTQRDEPPHFRNRERARSRSPRRNGRDDRAGRERDSGYGGRVEVKREPRDDGYGAREREREREGDRKRYEDDAVSSRSCVETALGDVRGKAWRKGGMLGGRGGTRGACNYDDTRGREGD